MADNLETRGPADGKRISLNEKWEVQYWTKTLNCSAEVLEEAVRNVGNGADAVREYLRNRN